MKRYKGGQEVRYGFYFSWTRKDVVTIEEDGGRLPGNTADAYVRVPAIFMLAAAPLLGLLYVMFLPFISFAMLFQVTAKKAWSGILQMEHRVLHVATASWRPGFSYFAWWKHPRKAEQAPAGKQKGAAQTHLIDQLEKEITRKREEGQI